MGGTATHSAAGCAACAWGLERLARKMETPGEAVQLLGPTQKRARRIHCPARVLSLPDDRASLGDRSARAARHPASRPRQRRSMRIIPACASLLRMRRPPTAPPTSTPAGCESECLHPLPVRSESIASAAGSESIPTAALDTRRRTMTLRGPMTPARATPPVRARHSSESTRTPANRSRTMTSVSRAPLALSRATNARTNVTVRSVNASPAIETRGAITASATSAHALAPTAPRAE